MRIKDRREGNRRKMGRIPKTREGDCADKNIMVANVLIRIRKCEKR